LPFCGVLMSRPDLSVVVPLHNEEESVAPLVYAVQRALASHPSWELVLVDDGSWDRTAARAAAIAAESPRVVLVRLARNYGQTLAMQAGFDAARGSVVVSMDGDLQNDPEDIPRLVATLEQGYDLVAGYRERRQDKLLTRRVPSWVANRIIRSVTGVNIRDNGCSLKAYRRAALDRMHLYSDMHRFLPALAAATAGARITEIPVRHHARRFGRSKYGLSRILKILADLLTMLMIAWFRERPLALFGLGAAGALGLAGFFFVVSVLAVEGPSVELADAYVLPAAALLWLLLACYLIMLGLLGEVAVRRAREEHSELLPIALETSP
jgi:glycosyltransferase involved in cell wall biosynthesis